MHRQYQKINIIAISLLFCLCTSALAMMDGPLVTFRFDGGACYYSNGTLDILNEYGFSATLYIPTTTSIGEGHCFNFERLREIQSLGWEIGSHTQTHPDLRTLGVRELTYELRGSKRVLVTNGLNVTSFACPYGYHNAYVDSFVRKWYGIHAITRPYGLNYYPYNKWGLVVKIIHSDTSLQTVIGWVDQAIQEQAWLIILIHGTIDGPAIRYNQCTLDDFRAIVEYVYQNNIPVVTISQAINN